MKLPLNESRLLHHGVLNNNIKYVLVNDKDIDIANVCVVVKAGSYHNPKEYQGLAHFLEHMLFLGSKKYPVESYFDMKVKQYNGYSNAYTATYETVYYFSIPDENLLEIMDIFSRFFIDPLFNKDSVDREINAVNSEHSKNKNDDTWIRNQMLNNISNKDSVVNTFSTGNLKTLQKKNIRDEMIKFYNKYYHANNISISVATKQNLKTFETKFRNIFNKIPKSTIKTTHIDIVKNYSMNNTEYVLYPVNNSNYIMYVWEIGYPHIYLKNMIDNIIIETIRNNDENNIQDVLINKKLIKSLYAYTTEEGLLVFLIDINGDVNKNIAEINKHVQHYFNNLNKFNWKKLYDNIHNKYNVFFNHSFTIQTNDLVEKLAMNLHYFDKENYYSGNSIILEKDYNKLNNLVNSLKFKNCNIIYCTKKINAHFKQDEHYNFKYGLIKKSLLGNEYKHNYNIITNNKYYNIKPKNINNLDKYEKVKLIKPRIWYGGTSKFNEPFFGVEHLFNHHKFIMDIETYVLTYLSINIINFYINKQFTKAIEMGYKALFLFKKNYSTLVLSIYGFNDLFNTFYNEVFSFFKNINIENKIIDIEINEFIEKYENLLTDTPWNNISTVINDYIFPTNINDKLAYNFIKKNKLHTKIKLFIKELLTFKNLPLTIFTYGNIKKENLPNFKQFNENLYLPLYSIPVMNDIKTMTFKHTNKKENNNLVMVLFELDCFTPRKAAIEFIINNIMTQPCYEFLRTKNQLGYLVRSGYFIINKKRYIMIKVQSEKNHAFVLTKINEFLKINKKNINNIKNLNSIKKSISNILTQKETSSKELYNKYFSEIFTREFMFDNNLLINKQLEYIDKNDVVSYYNSISKNPIVIKVV